MTLRYLLASKSSATGAAIGLPPAGFALNLLLSPFLDDRKPATLRRKLGLVLAGRVLLLVGLLINLFVERGLFHGRTGGWALTFSLIAALVMVVSLWCLTAAHVIGRVGDRLTFEAAGKVPVRAK